MIYCGTTTNGCDGEYDHEEEKDMIEVFKIGWNLFEAENPKNAANVNMQGAGWQKLAGFRRAQNNPSELS